MKITAQNAPFILLGLFLLYCYIRSRYEKKQIEREQRLAELRQRDEAIAAMRERIVMDGEMIDTMKSMMRSTNKLQR